VDIDDNMSEHRISEHPFADGPAGLVLVCDYPGSRQEAPISALRLEADGYFTRPLFTAPFSRQTTAAAYADEISETHGPFGNVTAVLAYCSAAPIAQELAARVSAASGVAVPLIAFDPELPTAERIEEEYERAAENLGMALNLERVSGRTLPALDVSFLRSRPDEVLESVTAGLEVLADRAVAQSSHDQAAVRGDATAIIGFYLDWFSHLLAAHNTSCSQWRGRIVQIVSEEDPCAPMWTGEMITTVVRIPTSRNSLLLHPEVRPAVLAVLKGQLEI
jgi:hypothetical protein